MTVINTISFQALLSFDYYNGNERFFNEKSNYVDKGEGFEENDHILSSLEKVSIILGYDYENYVDLWEIFTINYLEKNLYFYAKGFF